MKSLSSRGEAARQFACAAVQGCDYGLDTAVFNTVNTLRDVVPDAGWREAEAPDFDSDEWLSIVDAQGKQIAADEESDLPGSWIRPCDGHWMAQRWLTHAIGFRHRVIHLFLKPSVMSNDVILQLRSFDKANAPGCFDVTLGGHVRGNVSPQETLVTELSEELGLDASKDIMNLTACGAYDYHGTDGDGEWMNTEYRHVYVAALSAGAFDRIRYRDGEVAGLLTLTRNGAERLMAAAPEHIASGLRESYTYFAQH